MKDLLKVYCNCRWCSNSRPLRVFFWQKGKVEELMKRRMDEADKLRKTSPHWWTGKAVGLLAIHEGKDVRLMENPSHDQVNANFFLLQILDKVLEREDTETLNKIISHDQQTR